jgi:hypothetical protein
MHVANHSVKTGNPGSILAGFLLLSGKSVENYFFLFLPYPQLFSCPSLPLPSTPRTAMVFPGRPMDLSPTVLKVSRKRFLGQICSPGVRHSKGQRHPLLSLPVRLCAPGHLGHPGFSLCKCPWGTTENYNGTFSSIPCKWSSTSPPPGQLLASK